MNMDQVVNKVKEKFTCEIFDLIELKMKDQIDKFVRFDEPWLVELDEIRKQKLKKLDD